MKLLEIFQDTDGAASAKRFAFFTFIVLYVAVAAGVVFHGDAADVISFANGLLDKTAEIIKWLGGFILLDKTPAAVAAFKGKSSDDEAPKTGG